MATQLERVREEVAGVLMSRTRSALIVCLGATATISIVDLVLGRSRVGAQLARAIVFAILVFALRLSQRTGWWRSVRIALFVVILYAVLFASIGALGYSTATRAYLLIALAMGTAAYLPWGGGPQMLAVSIIYISLYVSSIVSDQSPHLTPAHFGQFSVVLIVTIFIARELHRQTVAHVSELLARRQKEQALAEEATVSTALVRVGQEMLTVSDSPDLLERLCRITVENLHCDSSHVFLWDPKDESFLCIAGHGDTPEQEEMLRVMRVPARMVEAILEPVKRDGLLQVDHSRPDAGISRELAEPFGVRRSIFLALHRRDELIGLLTAGRRRSQRSFNIVEERVGRGIAQLATMSLQNLSLLESLRHANTLKSEFVATMSHELRTPLHILMGYADLMREEEFGSVNEEQKRILDLMDKNAHELLDLINTTLDLSRLEAGRIRVDNTTFAIGDLLEEVEVDLASTVRGNPEIIFLARPCHELPLLTTDKAKLKVILKNLIGNAFKFTDRGRIEVSAEGRDRGIEFAVSDTGIGIAPDVQPIIFEAFHQGEASMTRSRGGVGLGLYIVRRLVGIMHGKVKLASTGPRGSTFTVWVPLSPEATATLQDAPADTAFETTPAPAMVALPAK